MKLTLNDIEKLAFLPETKKLSCVFADGSHKLYDITDDEFIQMDEAKYVEKYHEGGGWWPRLNGCESDIVLQKINE